MYCDSLLVADDTHIRVCLCSGYDRVEVDRLISEGKLTRENKSVSHSVSSLDKEDEDMDTIRKVSVCVGNIVGAGCQHDESNSEIRRNYCIN